MTTRLRYVRALPGVEPLEARCLLSYTIADLGSLGGRTSVAMSVNDFGQVVGYSEISDSSQITHAFRYDGGEMVDIGGDGTVESQAFGINDAGRVVGVFRTETGGSIRAFRTAANSVINPVTDDLGNLGGEITQARAINNNGWTVGYSTTPGNRETHAFLYSDGQMRDLGTLPTTGTPRSDAFSVNDLGQIVGYSAARDGHGHAFLYAYGQMFDLGALGGFASWARAINNSGQIAGNSNPSGVPPHAVLWEIASGIRDLGTLGGSASDALGINGVGQVVGYSFTSGDAFLHGFLYQDRQMTDLNDLIPPDSGWMLSQGSAINDSGQIVGYGTNPHGAPHAFLLTPDNQTSAAVLLLGVVATPDAPQAPCGPCHAEESPRNGFEGWVVNSALPAIADAARRTVARPEPQPHVRAAEAEAPVCLPLTLSVAKFFVTPVTNWGPNGDDN